MAMPRCEADILPLVARQVSLEAPVVAASPAPPDPFDFSPSRDADAALENQVLEVGDWPAPDVCWPLPESLLNQLDNLMELPSCAGWSKEAQAQIRRLAAFDELDTPAAANTLEALAKLADEAQFIASRLKNPNERGLLLSARYALSRRLAVWRGVHDLAGRPQALTIPVDTHPDQMLVRLNEVDALLGQGERASHWRRYLLTAQTRLLAEAGAGGDSQHRRRHAQRVLQRMESSGLTPGQCKFLAQPEFEALAGELRAWAAEPFQFSRLLQTLEEYEQQPSAAAGRTIADVRRRLTWVKLASADELARHLDMHYRNANVRTAVSQELLTRLAPAEQTSWDRVDETIAGAEVIGRSQTTSQIGFRVLPDPNRLRIVLEATGQAISTTQSSKSGAVFHSHGQTWFRAQKEIVFDGNRVTTAPAVAEARVVDRLRDISTDYDAVPLVNALAQSLARQGHADARHSAQREAERKVELRVARRLDEEAEKHLADFQARIQHKIIPPLAQLALQPTPIELRTTDQRLIGRYRLADDLQLAAHTARPQAPSDSLLSVQVHESALNNALEQLPLADRKFDLPTLFQTVAEAMGVKDPQLPDDLPVDVVVHFADEEPLRVDLIDGLGRVTIQLAELKTDDRRWRNVMARAYYRPRSEGLTAWMERDGHLELTGDRLRLRDQIALRAIFAKVFSERRTLRLTPEKAALQQLQDCQVTQLTVRNGWIGLAIGPGGVSRSNAVAAIEKGAP